MSKNLLYFINQKKIFCPFHIDNEGDSRRVEQINFRLRLHEMTESIYVKIKSTKQVTMKMQFI